MGHSDTIDIGFDQIYSIKDLDGLLRQLNQLEAYSHQRLLMTFRLLLTRPYFQFD